MTNHPKRATWTHKVVKIARGMDGRYFDFRTAATFASETDAVQYAETFAESQRGVLGAKITVRTRGNHTIHTIAIPE